MPGCGGSNKLAAAGIEVTGEDITEVLKFETDLEALKDTDPVQHAKLTEPKARLKRVLHALRIKSLVRKAK